MEIEEKNVWVSYNFYLPDHQKELDTFSKAQAMDAALCEIYNRARHQWRYNDEASEELIKFAEEIGDLSCEFQ